MKDIVLSGASGFVGKNLLSYLDKGNSYNIFQLSLRENVSLNGFIKDSSIIHLAGKAHDLKKTSKADEYYQVNYDLTKQLYDAFMQSDAKKFIFISSVKAVTDSASVILNEDHVPNPQTHYGKSKLMAEEYIQSQPLPEGKSYYILRPCMIHGPGNKGNLNLLYNFVSKGLPYPLAGFENKRSFLSVENLCFIIKEIIENTIPSGVYHVADDEALSTNDVVTLIAQATGRSGRLMYLPKNFIYFLAKIGDKLKLPLNTERLEKLTENYVISNQKIKQAMSKELPLSSRQGIIKTAQAFANA